MRLGTLNISNGVVGFDTETTGTVPYGSFARWGFYPARPFEWTFCDCEGNTADVRWEVDPMTRRVVPNKKDLRGIREILEDPKITKIGHNLSFDIRMAMFSGVYPVGPYRDTLFESHILTGGSLMTYGLKELGQKFLDVSKDDEKALEDSTKKARREARKKGWRIAKKEDVVFGKDKYWKADYWLADRAICSEYAIQDAVRTLALDIDWWKKISNDENMLRVFKREMKLMKVILKMELRGPRVFPSDLRSLREWYVAYQNKQQRIANRNGGKGLNYNSPKQMIHKFVVEKGYKPKTFGDETKSGKSFYPQIHPTRNPKIDGDFLKHIAEEKNDKLAKAVLEYRGSGKMIAGFLDPYDHFRVKEEGDVNSKIWVLHPNYRQIGPATGRIACGDPNLMQVASKTTGRRRTDVTLRPREAFGPRPGFVWYLPDYSQIEVWVFSFLAKETAMIEALMRGEDFHGAIARQVWGKGKDADESAYFRKRAKLLMFCKLYGGGVKKVAYLIESSYEEADKFVAQYDERLPGVKKFMEKTIAYVEEHGKITNPLGRSYYLPSRYAYKAVNYMVQGTSADILKNAMIRIDRLFQKRWKGCHTLLTLHDEIALEIPLKYHSKKLMREIIHEMQRDSKELGIPVPLPVGMKIAKTRWSDTQEIESLTREWKEKYLCKNK